MASTGEGRRGRVNLVTGGSGFLGGHLVRALRGLGEHVRVLDRVEPPPDTGADEFVPGSVTDADAVARASRGAARVFHLAALADLWIRDKDDYLRVNHEGTRHVLEAAAATGVETVLHCSTEAVLTRCTGEDEIVDEGARPSIDAMPGPYCRAKLLAEREAFAAAADGRRVLVVSPTAPIGPGDRNLTPPTRMLLGFLNGDYPAYLETSLNLVDARDVARGFLRAAEHGVAGRRYVLAGRDIELSRLLVELEGLTGLPMVRRRVPYRLAHAFALVEEWLADHVTRRPPDAPLTGVRLAGDRARFDARRAREELGFVSRPLADSLRDAIEDLRARGLLRRSPRRPPDAAA